VPVTVEQRGVVNFASEIDPGALEQAERTARLPVVFGHVALMPDAHVGIGATVGSVIATKDAIIPSAVGVDIGCGMAALRTTLVAGDLSSDLSPLLRAVAAAIPAGVGKAHEKGVGPAEVYRYAGRPATVLTDKQEATMTTQWGTLGSGNHFFEVSTSEKGDVWLVIHSGSRGIGNQLAMQAMEKAQAYASRKGIQLEDPNLAYLEEGTPEFDHYWADLTFAQKYAFGNRERMLTAAQKAIRQHLPAYKVIEEINCHHNYAEIEQHRGARVYVTRKGAIRARTTDRGIIPGSMGASTYIVVGLGHPDSYESAPHGAGRRLSRGAARRSLSVASLRSEMAGRVWLDKYAEALLDEHPAAYKDIDQVMEDSKDLVRIEHRLSAVLNYKGL
jgi:RNA-splicing ligase RtcB